MGLKFTAFKKRSSLPRPKAKTGELIIYADEDGFQLIDETGSSWPIGAADPGEHSHSQYSPVGHDHGETEHPDLATHESLGLAPQHDHPFAADDHTHAGGDHPDLAAHTDLGLSAAHEHDYAPVHSHPYAADDHTHAGGEHTHDEYATDADLTTHASTAHGTSSHAIDGAYHSGSEVLPTQGQKNALAGTSGTPGTTNQYVTHQDSRLSDARTPTAHVHDYAADDHTHDTTHNHDADYADTAHTHTLVDGDIPVAIARDAEVTSAIATHAATPHGGGTSWEFPVGNILIDTTNTNPATWLGYGTWAHWGAGRFLLGTDTAAEVEAGSATHSHSFTQPDDHTDVIDHTHTATVTDPQHAHVQGVNSATTGGTSGYTPDTSTNTRVNSGYSTSNAATGISVANASPAGAVASLTHAGGAVTDGTTAPLSITAFLWKRTA